MKKLNKFQLLLQALSLIAYRLSRSRNRSGISDKGLIAYHLSLITWWEPGFRGGALMSELMLPLAFSQLFVVSKQFKSKNQNTSTNDICNNIWSDQHKHKSSDSGQYKFGSWK